MLRVLGMQVIGLLVWSFDARHLFSPSGYSQLIGYGRVLGEVYAWHLFWLVLSHGTLLRAPRTSGVLGLLRQIVGPTRMLGPARAPPFGQYPVMGPNSVVRENHRRVGCLQGQMLGPARAPPFVSTRSWDLTPWLGNHRSCLQGQMLGLARAPPFGQYPVIGPDSVVRKPQELSARADVGSCSGTSFWSVPGHGT
ncbi:hypothetical protein TIFTF001_053536 [Ficus carica]|uniref:Uncharacterized protein n=1 Tax=Ficus carica TaxID=3494 RepID=A0AA88EE68_FICCA|nr:hypothetical protein TIFTF001_053529 [Ficus carica]GMN72328.1 hypothetical protein TIFTF001_053536 [Ficus carica]